MFNNILVAVQGEESEHFLQQVVELIKLAKPRVSVIHVRETGLSHYGYVDQLASGVTKEQFIDYIFDMADDRQKQIYNTFKELGHDLGIDFLWMVREGTPGSEITQEVDRGNYDLVILGTKPKSPGNTSKKVKEKVLNGLSTSILIIK
ncbi:MAG: universal stress protein [Bacillota bacterium]